MSVWEFSAYIEGWNHAHNDKPQPPTEEEFERAWAREEEIFGPTVH